MKRSSQLCPRYQKAVELLGKRWTALVVQVLLDGPRRFGELAAALEVVGDRVLSQRLKELEAEGVVTRRVLTASPIGVLYELTEKGRALSGVVGAIQRWAEGWIDQPRRRARA